MLFHNKMPRKCTKNLLKVEDKF